MCAKTVYEGMWVVLEQQAEHDHPLEKTTVYGPFSSEKKAVEHIKKVSESDWECGDDSKFESPEMWGSVFSVAQVSKTLRAVPKVEVKIDLVPVTNKKGEG